MTVPLISVVIPTYQDGLRAVEAIKSVIKQDISDWEIILIDDGSSLTDQRAIVQAMATLRDPRLRYYISGKNRGPARARNLGIRFAQGRYIAFLDADDLWVPEKLRVQVEAMQAAGVSLSCTGYENLIVATGQRCLRIPPAQITYQQLLRQNTMGCSTVMVDRNLVGRSYFPDIRMRQDFAHWLQILRPGDVALGLPAPLTQRRCFENSLSSNKIRAAWHTWRMYRDIEKLNLWQASSCFMAYASGALAKRKIRA